MGVAIASAPAWEGAKERSTALSPALQAEWSSGLFVAGRTLGIHLSDSPKLDYGAHLNLHPKQEFVGGARGRLSMSDFQITVAASLPLKLDPPFARLRGVPAVDVRPEMGGFLVAYLAPHLRLSNQLYYGAGQGRNGLRHSMDLQYISSPLAAHHRFSAAFGFTLANAEYQQSYFGVSASTARANGLREYRVGAGVKDIYTQLRWNWVLSPSWLISSSFRLSRLQGNAAQSPLVERPSQLRFSTALAYRL
jgi:outer membrane scaffolding protein for murein synthesis (MipA/OmpV family)